MKDGIRIYLRDRMPHLSDEEVDREAEIIASMIRSSFILSVDFDGAISTVKPVDDREIEKIVDLVNDIFKEDANIKKDDSIINEAKRIINGETT